ncbi:MAG: outer membrane protein [Motiliproteus sp.]|jgi:outer membrane protein
MKNFKVALLGLLLLPALVLAEGRIAVLDMDAALAASKQAQSLRAKLQQEFVTEEAELRTLSEEGNALKAKLENEGSFMSDAERQKLSSLVQQKYKQFTSLGNQVKQATQVRERDFLQQLRPKIETIMKALVESEKLDMIVNKKGVVYVQPELDLTPRLVEELNKL